MPLHPHPTGKSCPIPPHPITSPVITPSGRISYPAYPKAPSTPLMPTLLLPQTLKASLLPSYKFFNLTSLLFTGFERTCSRRRRRRWLGTSRRADEVCERCANKRAWYSFSRNSRFLIASRLREGFFHVSSKSSRAVFNTHPTNFQHLPYQI